MISMDNAYDELLSKVSLDDVILNKVGSIDSVMAALLAEENKKQCTRNVRKVSSGLNFLS